MAKKTKLKRATRSKASPEPEPPAIAALTLRVDRDLHAAMMAYHAESGIPISAQMRKAIAAWLTDRGAYAPKK